MNAVCVVSVLPGVKSSRDQGKNTNVTKPNQGSISKSILVNEISRSIVPLFECTSLLPSLAIHVAFFVKAYFPENQVAWLDGIESAFAYYDGVPLAIVSDNSRCLVNEHRNRFVNRMSVMNRSAHIGKLSPLPVVDTIPKGKERSKELFAMSKVMLLLVRTSEVWTS